MESVAIPNTDVGSPDDWSDDSAASSTSAAPRPGNSLKAVSAPNTATPAPAMQATCSPLWKASKAIDSNAGRAARGAWPTTASAAAMD